MQPKEPGEPRASRAKPASPRAAKAVQRPSQWEPVETEAGIETEVTLQREALGAALRRINQLEQMVMTLSQPETKTPAPTFEEEKAVAMQAKGALERGEVEGLVTIDWQ